MKIPDLIKRIGELKEIKKQVEAELPALQIELYQAMKKQKAETFKTPDSGQATIMYKTEIIVLPEGLKIVSKLDEEVLRAKMDLENKIEAAPEIMEAKALLEEKSKEKSEIKKKLLAEGLAKEDKQFSYIKYTAPKKKKD